jgi:hypothetical protein
MQTNLYSVYDQAAESYTTPMALKSDGQAKRAFCDHVMKDESAAKFPEDYSIWYVGKFDDQTGQLIQEKTDPRKLMTGMEAIAVNKLLIINSNKENPVEIEPKQLDIEEAIQQGQKK